MEPGPMAADKSTRVVATLSDFAYDETAELAQFLGITQSRVVANAIEQWVSTPSFGAYVRRARERFAAKAIDPAATMPPIGESTDE